MKRQPWFVTFASFPGVHTLTVANFKLVSNSTSHWKLNRLLSGAEPSRADSSTPWQTQGPSQGHTDPGFWHLLGQVSPLSHLSRALLLKKKKKTVTHKDFYWGNLSRIGQKLGSPMALDPTNSPTRYGPCHPGFTSGSRCLTCKIEILILMGLFWEINEIIFMKYLPVSQYDFLLCITTINCLWYDATCKNQNTRAFLCFFIRKALAAWHGGGGDSWRRAWGAFPGEGKYSLSREGCGLQGSGV